jgi:hypothetical protein|tara:strand:+ start:3102 stop:3266 length:165 start_codon:yes stop_codon:yes gene_type:complete
MSIAQEFQMFVKRYWMAALEEREAFGEPYLAFDDYADGNKDFLLDEWHRHKFGE